jgi:hypothetical protein
MNITLRSDKDLPRGLPLPLAQLYRQAQNAGSALERHQAAWFLWEAALKLLSYTAVVEYAQRSDRDPSLAERVQSLAPPSRGSWWESSLGHCLDLVRLLVPVLACDGDAGFQQVRELLLGRGRKDLPRAAGVERVLREAFHGEAVEPRAEIRLSELFDRLITYRNHALAPGVSGRTEDFFERIGRVLREAFTEVFADLDVLAGRRLVFVTSLHEQHSGGWLLERQDLTDGTPRRLGALELPASAQLPRPGQLYLERARLEAPIQLRTPVHPVLVYDPEREEISFLNGRPGDHPVYLCYTTGRQQDRPDLDGDVSEFLARLQASPEPDDISPRLRYAIENQFPYPIARPFHQLRGIDDWLAEITPLANVLGAALEFLAVLALADYLDGRERDTKLEGRLAETFRQPLSHGKWVEVLRDVLTFLKGRGQTAFSPELLAAYFPGPGGRSGPSLKELGDELVRLRNDLIKRATDGRPSREKQHQFKCRLVEFLQAAGFLKDYPLVSVKATTVQDGVKLHACRLYVGCLDVFEQVPLQCELDLEAGRVAVLNPHTSELLYLHPFYRAADCPRDDCGAFHLFHLNSVDGSRADYLATGEHQFRDPTAGDEWKRLLQQPGAGRLRRRARHLCLGAQQARRQLNRGERIGGRYEVVEHLRPGGMADVYRVKKAGRKGFLALKLLPFHFLRDRTLVERFRQEAAQARGLEHEHIVRVLEYGEDLADHFLVMELATGWPTPDGRTALDAGELPRPLAEATALAVVRQACEALDHIHQRGMIHRDVKPGNLLLFPEGKVKLGDFGIARSRDSLTLTATGFPVGTPEYVSPEQAEGTSDLTAASDVFSLGVVLYELLTGTSPFKRQTPLATVHAVLHEKPPDLRAANPAVAGALSDIVRRCLEKDPARRFRSAREVYQAITAYEQLRG